MSLHTCTYAVSLNILCVWHGAGAISSCIIFIRMSHWRLRRSTTLAQSLHACFFCCAVPCLTHSYSRLRRSSTSLSYIRGPVFSRGSSQQSSMSLEFLCCIHTCHASHASHSIESQLFLCMLHTHALAQVTRNNISFLGMLRCIHIFRCAAVVTSLSVIVSILYKQPVAA